MPKATPAQALAMAATEAVTKCKFVYQSSLPHERALFHKLNYAKIKEKKVLTNIKKSVIIYKSVSFN